MIISKYLDVLGYIKFQSLEISDVAGKIYSAKEIYR